jgi:imidazolonepropionase-like amidohydrolase
MELMVEYGMKPIDVLRAATSVNASIFGYADKLGRIRKGFLADIIVIDGDPSKTIFRCPQSNHVMKDGIFYYELID